MSHTDHTSDAAIQPAHDPCVFDPAALLNMCMGHLDDAQTVLGMFRERLPGMLEVIEEHLTGGDVPHALSVLHTLKANAGSLCAKRLSQATAALEKHLRDKEESDFHVLLDHLKAETELFLQVISADLDWAWCVKVSGTDDTWRMASFG